jgi:ubiquinone/menaquinone biosynthesis C-methylase UbiE
MRYASLRDEVRRYLEEQGKLVMSESMQKVRAQFELFDAKKQAAPLLRQYIDENRIDEVIMLLSSLKPQIQKEILRQFVEQEDRDRLYRIQRKMLAGEPMKPEIDARLKELEQLDAKQK